MLGDAAGREAPVRDLRHRGHFGGSACDEALGEACEFFRHDAALDHFDICRLASAIAVARVMPDEEAIGDRGVDLAVLDEEDIGAGAFGDPALPVEHHGIGESSRSARCLEIVQIA